MQNIKIVTYDNFPFGGAPANYMRYFALSLSLIEGNNVEVILPTGNYGIKSNLNRSKIGNVDKVLFKHLGYLNHPTDTIGKLIDNILGFILPFLYFVKQRINNKVDVIIIYNTRCTITIPFLIIKWIIGKKLVIILPEYYEKPTKKYSLARINWLNFYVGIEYFVKFADKFIVLTDYIKNHLISKQIKDENILLLPNITDPDAFNLKDVEEYRKGKITIGYSGTPTRKDGILDLIDSFALLLKKQSEIHLLIIGDAANGNSILPGLKEKILSHGISDNVTFTGIVPFSEVPRLLNSCQILALTRPAGVFAEAGFPTKLGEYFACKKPVLVTSVGDINKYFVNEVHAIIAKPDDIENIANGFEKLILKEELRKNLVIEAYKWLSENLNYRALSTKINDFIS
jgi:glycosyltransferase involved in cell wall biosynthesis